MAIVSISEAIALFAGSETGRGARAGNWARRVVNRLRYLHDTEEIGFGTLPVAVSGGWRGRSAGYDMLLSAPRIRSLPEQEKLPYVSLVLVHEAVHATEVLNSKLLYDELMGRQLSVFYFRELWGPGVVNTLTGKRIRAGDSRYFSEFRRMHEALKADQLIDLVLDIELYTDDDYLTRSWVLENWSNWGGIKNRWPETKRLYAKKLLGVKRPPYESETVTKAAANERYLVPLLVILESIADREEWTEMMSALSDASRSGTLWTLQVSLESLLGNRSYAARIGNLELRWGTALTERPGTEKVRRP